MIGYYVLTIECGSCVREYEISFEDFDNLMRYEDEDFTYVCMCMAKYLVYIHKDESEFDKSLFEDFDLQCTYWDYSISRRCDSKHNYEKEWWKDESKTKTILGNLPKRNA